MDPLTSFFSEPLGQNPVLKATVHQQIKEVWPHDPSPQLHSSGCLIADIEAYLNSLLLALPLLAERLVNGPHMNEYISEQMDRMQKETDFSEFGPLPALCDKTSSLRRLVTNITKAIESMNDKPFGAGVHESRNTDISSDDSRHLLPPSPATSRTALPLQMPSDIATLTPGHTNHQFLRDDSTRESSPVTEELLEKVSCRGKGQWTCPYPSCKFGGVEPDGSLVVFERNSAFKAHLQRHRRPFRCDMPGCTNKKGFARSDQLRRHQESASHG